METLFLFTECSSFSAELAFSENNATVGITAMNLTIKFAFFVLLASVAATYLLPGSAEKLIATETNSSTGSEPISEASSFQARAPQRPQANDDVPQRAVKIPVGRGGHFFMDARVNGTRIPFMVDTGASAIALSYEHARQIGVLPPKSEFKHPVNTANGRTHAAAVTLDLVRYESIRLRNVRALVLDKGALNGESLLGNTFLSRLQEFKIRNGELVLIP